MALSELFDFEACDPTYAAEQAAWVPNGDQPPDDYLGSLKTVNVSLRVEIRADYGPP